VGKQFHFGGEAQREGIPRPVTIEPATLVEIVKLSDPAQCLYDVLVKDSNSAYENDTLLNIKQDDLKPIAPVSMSRCKFENVAGNKVYLNGNIPLALDGTDDLDKNVDLVDVEATVIEGIPGIKPNPCLYKLEITSGEHEDKKTTNTVPEERLSKLRRHGSPPPPPPTTTTTTTPPPPPGVIKRAKISSLDQLNKGGPTGREIIHLAGQKYYIDYDKEARKRRSEIFSKTGSSKKLTDDEQKLLDAIGITENTYDSLKQHLADFFNTLPSCQSSSQMITNRKCETAYYIIWSVLLKARQETQQKMNENAAGGISETETYMLSAATDAMSGVPGKKNLSENDSTGIMAIIQKIESELAEIKTTLDTAKAKR